MKIQLGICTSLQCRIMTTKSDESRPVRGQRYDLPVVGLNIALNGSCSVKETPRDRLSKIVMAFKALAIQIN